MTTAMIPVITEAQLRSTARHPGDALSRGQRVVYIIILGALTQRLADGCTQILPILKPMTQFRCVRLGHIRCRFDLFFQRIDAVDFRTKLA